MIDNGTHSIDIARYLLGPLDEIQAVEGKRVQDLPVEDTVRIFARSESGVMASIDLSWSLNKQQPYYVSVYGTERYDSRWLARIEIPAQLRSGLVALRNWVRQIQGFRGAARQLCRHDTGG